MKRFLKCICLILVMATLMAFPAQAAEMPDSRASNYFMSVGTSTIKIMRSTDNVNWTTVKTYTKDTYYAAMIGQDTSFHASCVTYTGSEGYYYKALVTFYAKEGNDQAMVYRYTDTFYF